MFRLLAIFIFLFWLVMTGLLLQSVFFPETTRLAKFSARELWEVFLKTPSVTDGVVLKDGEKWADFSIEVAELNSIGRQVIVHLLGEWNGADAPGEKFIANLRLRVSEDRSVNRANWALTIPAKKSSSQIEATFDPFLMKTASLMDGSIVDEQIIDAASLKQVEMLMRLSPLAIKTEELGLPEESVNASLSDLIEIEVHRGRTKIGDHQTNGFIATLEIVGEKIELFFTEDGGFVRATTSFGWSILSQAAYEMERKKA